MNRIRKLAVVIFLLSPMAASPSWAVPIPVYLNPGDQYRLVFHTLDPTTALSPDIHTYDAFVTAQANTSADLVALGTTWRVIGSTSSISAKFHTDTDDSGPGLDGVPIYRLDGAIVAANYDDLWDGSIFNAISVEQDGSNAPLYNTWTGTSINGLAVTGYELGAPSGQVVDGATTATGTNWVQTRPWPADRLQGLYAISDILTVPSVSVPEPSTLALLGIGLFGMGLSRRKKLSS